MGEFVENLRRELHPELPHLAAHLTILPPRLLPATETAALETLERLCGQAEPFEVNLGDVENFFPKTPTVFIKVNHAASRMTELHNLLNTQALVYTEEWPYIPHLTIVKMAEQKLAQQAYETARRRWAQYHGNRRILLERLSFVREEDTNCWIDLAAFQLGKLVHR